MKRILQIALLTFFATFAALLAVYIGTAWHERWGDAPTRIQQMQTQIDRLGARIPEALHVRHAWVHVGSSPSSKGFDFVLAPDTNILQRYTYDLWKETGRPVAGWVSKATPPSEMAKFCEFGVGAVSNKVNGIGAVQIEARLSSTNQVSMDVELTILVEGGYHYNM